MAQLSSVTAEKAIAMIRKMVPDAEVTTEEYITIKVSLKGKTKSFSDTYYIGNGLWDLINGEED